MHAAKVLSHRVLLAVHTAEPPLDAEWDAYMNLCEKVVAQMKCNIVYTEGGGPNARQRTRINKLDALKPIPTIVILRSPLVRGIVTAIGWLGKNIAACAPADVDRLGQLSGLEPAALEAVLSRIAAMKLQLVGKDADRPTPDKERVRWIVQAKLPELAGADAGSSDHAKDSRP